MATEIRVPTLGESVTEATIGKWFKKVGDAIAADEPLVELETDKVTIEVPAPAAGTLTEIAAKEGDTVGVGALLGSIGEGGAKPAAGAPKPSPKPLRRQPDRRAPRPSRKRQPRPPQSPAKALIEKREMPPAPRPPSCSPRSSLSADQVAGSGKRGQVLKGDVLDAIAKGAPPHRPVTPAAPSAAARAVACRATSRAKNACA